MNTRRTLATTGIAALLVASLSVPGVARSERMELRCAAGTLAGHTIERSNGASWWDERAGTVYTTRHVEISAGDETVFEKTYGLKSGPTETCTAEHFGFVWTVELAASGR